MLNDKLNQAAMLKLEITQKQAQYDALLDEILAEDPVSHETDFGKFIIVEKTSYTFPPEVMVQVDLLKQNIVSLNEQRKVIEQTAVNEQKAIAHVKKHYTFKASI